MQSEIILSSFDWSICTDDQRSLVDVCREEIHGLCRQSLYTDIEIGVRLLKIKECLGHGFYRKWLDSDEFPWGFRFAYGCECLAQKAAALQSNVHLMHKFDRTAAKLLSEPRAARAWDEAIKLASTGETITLPIAKSLMAGESLPLSIGAGRSLTVEDETSPLNGQTVTVLAIDKKDGIATCETESGNAVALPLAELQKRPLEQKATAPVKPKPVATVTVEADYAIAEIEEERIAVLEGALREAIALLERYAGRNPTVNSWLCANRELGH